MLEDISLANREWAVNVFANCRQVPQRSSAMIAIGRDIYVDIDRCVQIVTPVS